MSVASAEKIFIDADDEINFIVGKILNAEKPRAILVIPQHALIASSIVSVKVLAKQILESKKLMVIVTEDEFTKNLFEKAGIVVVGKVSDVTPEVWERVQIAKEREIILLQKHQKKLLDRRKEPAESILQEVNLEEVADTEAEQEVEGEAEEFTEEEDEITEEPVVEPEAEKEIIIPQKKRIPAKMVQIAGLQLYVGGDIQDLDKVEPDEIETEEEVEVGDGRIVDDADDKTEILGKDWTKVTKTKSSFKLPKFNLSSLPKNRLLIYLVVILLFLGVAIPVVSAMNSFAVIDVSLKTADILIEEQITARSDLQKVNTEKLLVPALEITSGEVSRSSSATATGTGIVGEKALGKVDFYNKSDAAITIKSGTVIENVGTNLKFELTQEVVIPKPANADAIEIVKDISVRALEVGDKYNLKGGENTQFIVSGYSSDDLVGIRIRDFEGGTSKEVTVVSKEDIEKLKKTLEVQVKEAAGAELLNNIPDGYILLEGSEKYEEVKVESEPKQAAEANSFDLTLAGNTKAFAISEEHLREITVYLIEEDDIEGDFDVDQLELPEIAEVLRKDNQATFKLASEGKLQSKVSASLLKKELAGKNIAAAIDYLAGLSEIDEFSINYTPTYLPEFLKNIPTDPDRIKIRINGTEEQI